MAMEMQVLTWFNVALIGRKVSNYLLTDQAEAHFTFGY